MNEPKRGALRNKEYARQLRDFTGLCFGKITPTDIDAFLDFGDRLFVFIEAKHGDAPLKRGQELALERLCDRCQAGGVDAIVFVASHTCEGDVPYAELPVRCFYKNGYWRKPRKPIKLRDAVDRLLAQLDMVNH